MSPKRDFTSPARWANYLGMIGNRIQFTRHALALVALALMIASGHVMPASAGGSRGADAMRAEFRSGWTRADGTHMAALHLHLAEGWMTYWRVPGESGLAMQMDWSGSGNVAGIEKHWPVPRVFVTNGYHTIGYRDELVLPIAITPTTPGHPMVLEATVTLGVCREVCIPVDMRLLAELAPGARSDPVIETALADAPGRALEAGLTGARCRLSPDERNRMRLSAELDLPSTGGNERVILEVPGQDLRVRDLGTRRHGGVLQAEALVQARKRTPLAVDRSQIRLTVLSDAGAVEHVGCTGFP